MSMLLRNIRPRIWIINTDDHPANFFNDAMSLVTTGTPACSAVVGEKSFHQQTHTSRCQEACPADSVHEPS
jgi:hypothetical protein